ncbi:hypothetical protein EK904_006356 [Melospiza melodia maxima]|nr:hypothetical protein EK904_006356 [Melospiza melodia maxima]
MKEKELLDSLLSTAASSHGEACFTFCSVLQRKNRERRICPSCFIHTTHMIIRLFSGSVKRRFHNGFVKALVMQDHELLFGGGYIKLFCALDMMCGFKEDY